MKKNVYLIQPNNSLSGSLYLPYSIGTIAAYCFQFEHIRQNYNLCDFIFIKTPIDETVATLQNPYLIGFSNYMWNVDYNLELARKVKEKWSDAIIVFGGPQIPDDTSYLEKYDCIDLLIHGEGETVFYSLLDALTNKRKMSEVFNISYRTSSGVFQSKKAPPGDLSDFPSPYTAGLFDSIINDEKYKDIQFDAVIETNRGCPYGCVYCYWARSGAVFRQFPIERVKGDLEWIAKNKITYCFCADSNFGVLNRDEFIAEYVIDLKLKYNFPSRFETTSAKNKDDLVFRINKKLNDNGLLRGVALAIQSMTPEVLKIVGRANMTTERFSSQLKRYRENKIYTYTDIILGLPGETLDSFCKSLFSIIEAGQHSSITVYRCEMLPNTTLYSKKFRDKYKIKTTSSYLRQNHSCISNDLGFGSRSEVVVETNTMSMIEWSKAFSIAVCTQSFHCMGLLKLFAIYLRKAKNIQYLDFYLDLFNWIKIESSFIKNKLDYVCKSVGPFLKGESSLFFADERFGNIYLDFDEGLFLCCAAELDVFYKEVKTFLRKYFDNEQLFEDLLMYQKSLIALPSQTKKELTSHYNWISYFENMFNNSVTEPEKKEMVMLIESSGTSNWIDYTREIVWYGKRSEKTINKITGYIQK